MIYEVYIILYSVWQCTDVHQNETLIQSIHIQWNLYCSRTYCLRNCNCTVDQDIKIRHPSYLCEVWLELQKMQEHIQRNQSCMEPAVSVHNYQSSFRVYILLIWSRYSEDASKFKLIPSAISLANVKSC